MKVPARFAPGPMGKATAVTVAMCLCIWLFPLAAVVLVPFLPLPVAHLIARRGMAPGAVVALVSGGLVFGAVGMGVALPAFLIVLGLGTVVGQAARRDWRLGKSLATGAAAALGAFWVSGGTLWFTAGLSVSRLHESVDASIGDAAEFYTRMGVSAQTTDTVSGQLGQIAHVLPYLTPGLTAMAAVLLAGCSLGLAHRLFPRGREKVAVGLSLSGFRMHWAAAYASIGGLAMLVVARGSGEWRNALVYLGLNVLLVSQTVFFIQGFAVARWFALSRELRPGSRRILMLAAILGQALFQITGLFGLLDTWIDYRRRFAVKKPGTGSVR